MNYGQLKTAVASWCNRSDLTALMDTFRDLAEQRIYNGSPDLDVDQLRLSVMLTTDSAFAGTLAADCLQIHRVKVTLSDSLWKPLEYKPLEALTPYQPYQGQPAFYSVKGSSVVYGPSFDVASYPVELIYYARFATPSADADTNWLLTNNPSVYLYAMCMEVGQWLRDDALLSSAAKLYANAQKACIANDQQGQRSGATLAIRTDQSVRR